MFVVCSEISISVIVKHVQHIGIIRVFCLPGMGWGGGGVGVGAKKLLGCGLLVVYYIITSELSMFHDSHRNLIRISSIEKIIY